MIHALHYASGAPMRIDFDGGRISAIEEAPEQTSLPMVAPGLVDLQINGFAGFDFNALPLSEETVKQGVRAMWREGVTTCFPTIITNSAESIEQGMRAVGRACESDRVVGSCVGGIHLEGPFISPEDGARGAHAKQFVCAPDWSLFERWQHASGGRIRIVTLSPESPEACGFIERAVAGGVVVSIGHTSATSEQIDAAVRAGARLSTHLGNGAHLMLARHPNYLWEQLAQDRLSPTLIADGFHLPDQVLKVVLKVKENALLVSDAVALAGMAPGDYDMPVGGKVTLTAEGRLHLAGNAKLLAGSAQMLPHAIGHLVRRGLADLKRAWEMGSVRAGAMMGIRCGLEADSRADLVVFDMVKERVVVRETWKAGVRVYVAPNPLPALPRRTGGGF